jgi:hypothetical protein
VIHQEPRTNNLLEGWYIRFQAVIGKYLYHPSFCRLVQEVRKEQENTQEEIIEVQAGQRVREQQ